MAGNPGVEGVSGDEALRAYRDPITGRIGPPPPGVRLGGPRTTRSRQPEIEVFPDGGLLLDLGGHFEIVGRRSPDGRTSVRCETAGATGSP